MTLKILGRPVCVPVHVDVEPGPTEFVRVEAPRASRGRKARAWLRGARGDVLRNVEILSVPTPYAGRSVPHTIEVRVEGERVPRRIAVERLERQGT